jgi:hypothetical protein
MRPRIAGALASLLACMLLAATGALADGDPASDVLLGQNVFYPYSPPTAGALQKRLNAEVAALQRKGLRLKVALIGSPVDLGVVPALFGKPQVYAEFLDQEISFRSKQPLLVVMAAGYGSAGLPPKARAAVAALARPTGRSSDALAAATVTAVAKLAAAAGDRVSAGGASTSSGGISSSVVLLIVLVLAAVVTASALLVLRRRAATPR